MAQRRDRIPGVTPDAERVINQLTGGLDARLRKLERKAGRAGLVTSNTSAKPGEFLNIEAPTDGLTVIFPSPDQSLRGERITLSFRNANPVRLVCIGGLVNRAPFVVSTSVGTFEAICDGLSGWAVETGLSPSGSATSAQYVLGAAHGGLPNAAVGTDTAEVDFSFTPGGLATWVLNVASVGFNKLANLTGLSVLGRAGNSSGVMAAITATAARQTLVANDAFNAIGWAFPLEARNNTVDQGDAYALDFQPTTTIQVALPATVGGVATVSFQRSALSGSVQAALNSNVTQFAGFRVNGTLMPNPRGFVNYLSTTSVLAGGVDDGANNELEVTFQRAALSGAISALQNDNATLFSGIRVNGVDTTDRQRFNLIAGANISLTPADNAGTDSIDVTIAASGGGGSGVVLSVAVNLGPTPLWSGTFDVTGLAGLTLNSPVLVQTGISTTAPDESEEQIACSGIAISTSAFRVYWEAVNGPVAGSKVFHYVLPSTSIGSLTVQDDGVSVVSGVSVANFVSSNNISAIVTTPGAGQANVSFFEDYSVRFNDNTTTGSQAPYLLSAQPSTCNMVLFATGTGDITVHGIDGWYRSRRVRFTVSRTNTSTVAFMSESTTEAVTQNRIQGLATADGEYNGQLVIRAGESVVFVYDADSDRWRVESYSCHPAAAGGIVVNTAPSGNVTETRPFDQRVFCYDVTGSAGLTTTTIQAFSEGCFGDTLYVCRQGTGTDQLILEDNATGPTAEQLISIVGDKDVVLSDDEVATFVYTDLTLTAGTGERWACTSHIPPFCNTTTNVIKDKLSHNGTRWEVSQSLAKSVRHAEWWEDFEFVENGNPELSAALPSILAHFGNTTWGAIGSNTSTLRFVAGEDEHPGIMRMQTLPTTGSIITVHRGGTSPINCWVRADNFKEAEFVVRFVDGPTTMAMFVGLSSDPRSVAISGGGSPADIAGFVFDTANGAIASSISCITRNGGGSATNNGSGVSASGWRKLTLRQTTPGTIIFLIDDVVVNTHTTGVPTSGILNLGLTIITRTAAARTMDVDYAAFISQPLER